MIDHVARLAEIARLKAEVGRLDREWREASDRAQFICRRAEEAHVKHVDARTAYLKDCGL